MAKSDRFESAVQRPMTKWSTSYRLHSNLPVKVIRWLFNYMRHFSRSYFPICSIPTTIGYELIIRSFVLSQPKTCLLFGCCCCCFVVSYLLLINKVCRVTRVKGFDVDWRFSPCTEMTANRYVSNRSNEIFNNLTPVH